MASLEVWVKQLHDGSRAVVLFNRGASEAEISANWEELGYPSGLPAVVRDLWNKKDLGTFSKKVQRESGFAWCSHGANHAGGSGLIKQIGAVRIATSKLKERRHFIAAFIAEVPFPSVAEERCWCRWL